MASFAASAHADCDPKVSEKHESSVANEGSKAEYNTDNVNSTDYTEAMEVDQPTAETSNKHISKDSLVLVDGPQSGIPRQAYRLNNLQLTKFKLKFPYHAPTRVVRKQWTAADLSKKWEESAWAQKSKNVKQRTALNDFDRFKLRFAKKQRNKLLTIAYNTLKKRTKADGFVRVLKKDRKLRIQELKKTKKTGGKTGGKK